jgi:hypothetical protein
MQVQSAAEWVGVGSAGTGGGALVSFFEPEWHAYSVYLRL